MIKSIIRRLALSIPPMRRFYNFAMYQSHLAVEQQAHILELSDRAAAAEIEHGSLEKARATAEALDVQLYVLRSDLQRAAARNADLSHELHRLETASAQQQSDRATFDSLTRAIEAVRTDVQLGEARIGARVVSMLGGHAAGTESETGNAMSILDTLDYVASGALDKGAATSAGRLAQIRLVRAFVAQATGANGSASIVAAVRDAADAVIIRAAAVAGGASRAPLYLVPARSSARATVDFDLWRAEVESAFDRLQLSGSSVHVVSGHAHIPANAAGTAIIYLSVDNGSDVGVDLAQYGSSLLVGGVAILSSADGADVSRAAGVALTDLTGGTIEGAGTFIYARKRG